MLGATTDKTVTGSSTIVRQRLYRQVVKAPTLG